MSKRQKFVFTSLFLTGAFVFYHFLGILENDQYRDGILVATAIVSLLLSAWSLKEGLRKDATLLSLVLPTLFTLAVGFFFFYDLRLSSIIVKLPEIIKNTITLVYWFLYAIGMYATLLSSNIYIVASIRTIALVRTAHAVGFVLTLVTATFLLDRMFFSQGYPWINGLVSMAIAFGLVLQSLWSVELEEKITKEALLFSSAFSLGVGELAFMLSLWPVDVIVRALSLTTFLYVTIGIAQASLQGRLFAKTLKEYMFVGSIVFIIVYLSARWGG